MTEKEIIIGIDLGTSNSQACVYVGGEVKIIGSKDGPNIYGKAFPSYVAFTDQGVLVGEAARNQAIINPNRTIYRAKRFIGTDKIWQIDGKKYTPQQISAFILNKIKTEAAEQLECKINKAVITCPANFNDLQRNATKEAAELAGLEVVRLLNEPTAAALAYDIDKLDSTQKIIVFDLGGGTLDVSILEYYNKTFEVRGTSGDTQLGGTDMDLLIEDYFIKKFESDNNLKIDRTNLTTIQRIRDAIERAKIELSSKVTTNLLVPYLIPKGSEVISLNYKFDRLDLAKIIQPIINKFAPVLEDALKSSGLKKTELTKLVLVGGPCRMPLIREYVENYIGLKASTGLNPSECVAIGAAKQAAIISGETTEVLLLDVTPLSLGLETKGGLMTILIKKNTTIPYEEEQIFTTDQDNQTAVTIKVLQGERALAKDNTVLGMFNLEGIPKLKRGQPRINVKFRINRNGILEVTAKQQTTGKEQSITIKNQSKLSKEDLERIKSEMEQYEEQDKIIREKIETINEIKWTLEKLSNTLEENKSKISEQIYKQYKNKIVSFEQSINDENITLDQIKSKKEEIELLFNKFIQEHLPKDNNGQSQDGKPQ